MEDDPFIVYWRGKKIAISATQSQALVNAVLDDLACEMDEREGDIGPEPAEAVRETIRLYNIPDRDDWGS